MGQRLFRTDDESVPKGAVYSQQRTMWIAKVLKLIGLIHPGMTRRDLHSKFTTEAGLSTRTQQTFVYKDCPCIKVEVILPMPEQSKPRIG